MLKYYEFCYKQVNLALVIENWKKQISAWAIGADLKQAAQIALKLEPDDPRLRQINSEWANEDFSNFSDIVILDDSEMNGALGAYSSSEKTIYLNKSFAAYADKEDVEKILTEELGHYLDSQLNKADTPGDEGYQFSALLHGIDKKNNGIELLSSTKNENDSIEIREGDSVIEAEAAIFDSETEFWEYYNTNTSIYYRRGQIQSIRSTSGVIHYSDHDDTHIAAGSSYITKYSNDFSTIIWSAASPLAGTLSGWDKIIHTTTGRDGSFYAIGVTQKSLEGNNIHQGRSDIFIVKYLANGEKAWVRSFGSSDYDYCRRIWCTDDGDIIALVDLRGSTLISSNTTLASGIYYLKVDSSSGSILKRTQQIQLNRQAMQKQRKNILQRTHSKKF